MPGFFGGKPGEKEQQNGGEDTYGNSCRDFGGHILHNIHEAVCFFQGNGSYIIVTAGIRGGDRCCGGEGFFLWFIRILQKIVGADAENLTHL